VLFRSGDLLRKEFVWLQVIEAKRFINRHYIARCSGIAARELVNRAKPKAKNPKKLEKKENEGFQN